MQQKDHLDGQQGPLIDFCLSCRLFWFDARESLQLQAPAVLDLFRMIAGADAVAPTPVKSSQNCPRGHGRLAPTQDLQRHTRFTYWRCPVDGGKLITFHQFLREKNFVRAPSPAELARLRATIRQVRCSQCGASIDLERDSACGHCGSPIALVDPDGVAKALVQLRQAAMPRRDADVVPRPDAVDALLEHYARRDQARPAFHEGDGVDLLLTGAAMVGDLVSALLRR